MQIKQIKVTKLFGNPKFNYVIPMNHTDKITIIISPNGFGKTKILEMLNQLLMGTLYLFRITPFESYEVEFTEGIKVKISRKSFEEDQDIDLFINEERCDIGSQRDEFSDTYLRAIEDVAPVKRLSSNKFLDMHTGETINIVEVFKRYGELLSDENRKLQKIFQTTGIDKVKSKIIRTQRLHVTTNRRDSTVRDRKFDSELAVSKYRKDLRNQIQNVLALSAAQSQNLDSTFPIRLINKFRDQTQSDHREDKQEQAINERLERLEEQNERRREIAEVGLLDRVEDDSIPHGVINPAVLNVLDILIDDTRQKLDVFENLKKKIDLFRSIVNRRFQFKQLQIDREKGYIIRDENNNEILVKHLSSGEQHELVLIYDLLFKTRTGSLVIIDEPELSLHIDWQSQFLDDLVQIIEVSSFNVLIATHSPDILQDKMNLVVDLGQMVSINE